MKHTPLRNKKCKRADEPLVGSTLTRVDKLNLLAAFLAITVTMCSIFHVLTTHAQSRAFDKQIARWRHDYHLNDDQARRVRAIEEEFHGNGNPFMRPGRTPAEASEHHRQIAHVMNPEDAARFLKVQESWSGKSRPRH